MYKTTDICTRRHIGRKRADEIAHAYVAGAQRAPKKPKTRVHGYASPRLGRVKTIWKERKGMKE
jgi:hypothetical protein